MPTEIATPLSDVLRDLNACHSAVDWSKQFTADYQSAWQACHRGDWLLWIAGKVGIDRRLLVRAACRCARLALQYAKTGEARPLTAIETAEAWSRGEADVAKVQMAAYAAADAAYAAYAYAAAYAAVAASDAAYVAYANARSYAAVAAAAASAAAYAAAYAAVAASDAASAAAYAAAYAAAAASDAAYAAVYDAAYAAAAAYDAKTKESILEQCAALVREAIPFASVNEAFAIFAKETDHA